MDTFWQIIAGGVVSIVSILITAFIVAWKIGVDRKLTAIEELLHSEGLKIRDTISDSKESIIKHFEDKFVHKEICKTHHKKAA